MAGEKDIKEILNSVQGYAKELVALRETVLANTVMFGEIPAPTFGEDGRIRFLLDRFAECDLLNISRDEAGNGSAILPGKDGSNKILVNAHADTVFPQSIDHTIKLDSDRVIGPGVADNSLGLAVVATLPKILECLGIQLRSDLVFVGATQGLGRGDIAGLRFFLDNCKIPIHAGVCVEGVSFGRLSYSCNGMLRGVITCRASHETGVEEMNETSAIVNLNKVLTRILSIPTPKVPRTSITLGSISAGTAFNTPPQKASLQFEVRSEDADIVARIHGELIDCLDEMSAESNTKNELEVIASRQPGGIAFGHSLVRSTRQIMESLGVKSKIVPSGGELSALIAKGIPAVTLGITKGDDLHELTEFVRIEPMFKGIAQLVGVLMAIDEGVCDEKN